MKRLLSAMIFLLSIVVILQTFQRGKNEASPSSSYAIYAEYARESNKLMQNGLNRRVFNKVEAQSGTDISLQSDGSIRLNAGTYRMTGFSVVSMQTTLAPARAKNNDSYPGYALVYPKELEKDRTLQQHALGIGSPQTALYLAPSLFDLVYTTDKTVEICVGHQSGANLRNEVYLSVYEADGVKSDYHLHARITITKL
jgi:hypothetical protein